ncbi:hypothetical protein DFH94DRAFT_626717 [Russula ochroleuca]|uniref:Uncharacterized protein n=1 Tax=Russula ochroleuca TaxID=152965 RepID=A0A9P5TAW2_9AGAM|nr:hypothetical protein DFH94DRAFT_626717 [Russula ochroleuca]
MIDKSQGFSDAPPPYQHALRSSSDSKVNLCPTPNPSSTSLSKRHPKARTKAAAAPSRWFPTAIFGLSKTAKLVRTATQDFIRDLLSQARPSEHEWLSLLGNCADTCTAHGLSFSSILQEPFVEGHLPIYWAILKRPASKSASAAPAPAKMDYLMVPVPVASSDPDALVLAILDASLPLNALTVTDARLACVTVSDNALFVRLGQRYEAFSPRSGTDKVLLGGNDTVDTISVVETRGTSTGAGGGTAAAFTVHFSLTQFQLRMRVSKQARIEFIARGRLWYLAFSVAGVNTGPPLGTSRAGEWLVSLGLGENSAPAWVDGRLFIVDRSPAPPSTPDPPSVTHRHPHAGKNRNAASLPIKTSNYQIAPGGPAREVVVSLDKFLFGATLRNDATSFVDADGTLNAELEVKLQKTQDMDSNCVIC